MRDELIRQVQILSTQKFYAEKAPSSEYAFLRYTEKQRPWYGPLLFKIAKDDF